MKASKRAKKREKRLVKAVVAAIDAAVARHFSLSDTHPVVSFSGPADLKYARDVIIPEIAAALRRGRSQLKP